MKAEVGMDIKLKELNKKDFVQYGEAIFAADGQKPDSAGEGWECWFPLAQLTEDSDFSFGIVKSKPELIGTRFMERHLDRDEYVVALDHPVIQIVGLSDAKREDFPDINQTEAFLVRPGQIVKLKAGIWHAAGIAYGIESCLYLFLLGKPTKDGKLVDSGLVGFVNNESLIVK